MTLPKIHLVLSDDETGLTAYFTTSYDNLVESFGPPNRGPNAGEKVINAPGDKVTCEWVLKFGDEVITIYDWEQRRTPMGVYQWHSKGPIHAVLLALSKLDARNSELRLVIGRRDFVVARRAAR